MTEIGRFRKRETRWERLRRVLLGTAFGNFILCTVLVTLLLAWRGAILYGLIFGAIFGSIVAALRSKEWESAVKLVGGLLLAIIIIVGGAHWLGLTWKSHQAERPAEVRAVFLHPSDTTTGPQVYMSDGTVWALNDAPDEVRMVRGDEVHYVFVPTVPDGCELKDVTTGYATKAVRISAPFKHSSCPAQ
jgi:hypothetical protein